MQFYSRQNSILPLREGKREVKTHRSPQAGARSSPKTDWSKEEPTADPLKQRLGRRRSSITQPSISPKTAEAKDSERCYWIRISSTFNKCLSRLLSPARSANTGRLWKPGALEPQLPEFTSQITNWASHVTCVSVTVSIKRIVMRITWVIACHGVRQCPVPVKYVSGMNPGKAKDKTVKKRLIKRRNYCYQLHTH